MIDVKKKRKKRRNKVKINRLEKKILNTLRIYLPNIDVLHYKLQRKNWKEKAKEKDFYNET